MEKAIKPYLTYSFALHLALFGVAANVLRMQSAPASPIYNIDFVGPSAVIVSANAPAAAPGAAAAKPSSDDLSLRKGRPLPKPSLLKGYKAPKAEAAEPAQETSASESSAEASGPPSAGITTDMPNFPYPWYISQIRSSLWSQWSSRRHSQLGKAVVVFTVLPNGSMVDLRIEVSSGDGTFDLAALGAARDAGPFPPLPRGFEEPFLKIHVTLKK